MNDLGMTLAWSAVQVSLVLIPAAVLHALASRRSAASGSWTATVGLTLSVAISAATLIPWPRGDDESRRSSTAADVIAGAAKVNGGKNTGVAGRGGPVPANDTAQLIADLSRAVEGFRAVWSRLDPATTVPAARFRRWGCTLAVTGIAGAVIGLLRLFLGLWAVRSCRRRGTILNDPILIGLCAEIQLAMGCRQEVEIREIPELTAPATAGWWHPVIMLPDDWRSWDDADCRAVLAHELAHIHRWDYAAGLAARLALALEFYHPLAHWMARRLQLQQELAADAVGARFAGGRGVYLLTLSRLALKQDGRSPWWPARAFLPARGTLIRRISMLQDESMMVDRPRSGPRRLLAGLCLLGAALGVAMLRGPTLGDENERPSNALWADAPVRYEAGKAGATRFDLRYVSDEMEGMIAFRPAATFRRTGMAGFTPFIREFFGGEPSDFAKQFKIDLSAPGRLQLRLEDIEWVMSGLHLGHGGKHPGGQEMHRLEFGRLRLRTTGPFDWLRFLREWRFDVSEAHEGGKAYFKITGIMKTYLGSSPCVYLPDDRTIVLDEEAAIQKMLRRRNPIVPAYLAGADWERFSRGILAVAINNRDGKFAKTYDLGRPDDAVVLSLFKDVDRWILGVDDADEIVMHAIAACRENASATIAGAVESLVKMAQHALENPETVATPSESRERAIRMTKTLLRKLRIRHDGNVVDVHSEGFGTVAEFGALVEGEFKEKPQAAAGPRL